MAQSDNGNFNLIITFVVVMAGLYGLWYFFEGPIVSVLRWVKLGELHLVAVFTDRFDAAIRALPQMTVQPHAEKLQPGDLDAWTFWNISAALGDIMRWPVGLVLGGSAFWMLFHAPTAKFKNKYDLEGLMRIQSQSWPTISPVIDFDPGKTSARIPGAAVPAELPLFAESLSPDEWVVWARIPVNENEPDKEGIRQALIAQLGPRWDGLTGLKPHHRALLAAFALKGAQKRRESDDLLGLVAQGWTPRGDGREGGLVLGDAAQARINQVLNDKSLLDPALEQAARHGYRTTALLGVLRWARDQGGVLAPAQFLWLRGQDRALWYPLNNLGRRSYHAEAAGAMAHYMAERAAENNRGRALLMPRVETAIPPIIDYIRDLHVKGNTLPPLQEGAPQRIAGKRPNRKMTLLQKLPLRIPGKKAAKA